MKTEKQQSFTREHVIELIDQLLKCPDQLIDAVTNEYTNHDGSGLLELAEEGLSDERAYYALHPSKFQNTELNKKQ